METKVTDFRFREDQPDYPDGSNHMGPLKKTIKAEKSVREMMQEAGEI